jgi:glycosyltransferase involved in cell wall biosynthesis
MIPVSCICPTFDRIEALEESVQSFLNQEYSGDKELIIFNNFPKHEIVFDHPEVKVINHRGDETLGDFCNIAIDEYAKYDLIACWEDDDIYLKNNLSVRVKYLKDCHASLIRKAIIYTPNDIKVFSRGYCHAQMIFTRSIFNIVGGYNSTFQGHDHQFIFKIPPDKIVHTHDIDLDEISYIYRWGCGNQNLSSMFNPKDRETTKKVVEQFRQTRINNTKFQRITLTPNWKRDYDRTVKDFLKI